MLDSIYHTTLKVLWNHFFCMKMLLFCHNIHNILASGRFYHLLITFANSLDPDQAGQTVLPDLDPSCLKLYYS